MDTAFYIWYLISYIIIHTSSSLSIHLFTHTKNFHFVTFSSHFYSSLHYLLNNMTTKYLITPSISSNHLILIDTSWSICPRYIANIFYCINIIPLFDDVDLLIAHIFDSPCCLSSNLPYPLHIPYSFNNLATSSNTDTHLSHSRFWPWSSVNYCYWSSIT